MEKGEILLQVQDVVRDVLDKDEIVLTPTTTAAAIPDWDSLAHIKILVAVEKTFSIRFDADELGEMSNVGLMIDMIDQELGKKTRLAAG